VKKAPKPRRVADLVLDDKNANLGTERGQAMLTESLARFGAGRSILVDRDGRVIAGNKTVERARAAGMDELLLIPSDGRRLVAVQRTDLSLDDPEARALALADNRVQEVDLDWDPKVLAELGRDVDLGAFFNAGELEDMLGPPAGSEAEAPEPRTDKADEMRAAWKTERGQLWEIPSAATPGKSHRILCGDSASPADVDRLFAVQTNSVARAADLMATDPPYGVAYGVESGASGDKYAAIANDENDGPRLQAFLESVFHAAAAHLRPDAAWYLWHAQLTQGHFAAAAAAAAVSIHRQIIWVKPSLVLGHGDYHWRHELCFYGWRAGHRARWFGDRSQTTIWEIGRENDGVHPTQKPVEIFRRPMLFNTLPGELCYEPFAGSGTQLCAAEMTGRLCYAMELDPRYVAVALQRLRDMGLEPRKVAA
jgi:DNA modification methylase